MREMATMEEVADSPVGGEDLRQSPPDNRLAQYNIGASHTIGARRVRPYPSHILIR